MRYELTDHEWAAIKSMLPNKPRSVARVNDRRVLNGIIWVLRSGAPCETHSPNFAVRVFFQKTNIDDRQGRKPWRLTTDKVLRNGSAAHLTPLIRNAAHRSD